MAPSSKCLNRNARNNKFHFVVCLDIFRQKKKKRAKTKPNPNQNKAFQTLLKYFILLLAIYYIFLLVTQKVQLRTQYTLLESRGMLLKTLLGSNDFKH